MLYPQNLEEKLGFDKIRDWLLEACRGEVGRQYVSKVRFSTKPDLIRKLTAQTAEFKWLLEAGIPLPEQGFGDIRPMLDKAEILGTHLQEDEAAELRTAIVTIINCAHTLLGEEVGRKCPSLADMAGQLLLPNSLLPHLNRVLDENGRIRDNASPELVEIRRALLKSRNGIRRKVDELLRQYKQNGFAKEDASLTVRDGRLVIPIFAEYKRAVRGFVHGSSSSGQTLYVEPGEILDLNNDIKELEYREKAEIIRILTELTDQIRPEVPTLREGSKFLGLLDFVRAKARLAMRLKAVLPTIADEPLIRWRRARHPVLQLSFEAQQRAVVPQDLSLHSEQRILLISGPNAGGKSVTLKMTGLLQYMLQCGLLIPVEEGSEAGTFRDIMIDIGDEQSIENDLSTYSSHLANMRFFLQKAGRKSLCLIDEFGAGTEPGLGGAIAEAILESLHHKLVFGVITTHYGNLKYFADRNEGLVNGAMRYDVDHLSPLYELETGQPGSSFALEIARKMGLPQEVVKAARQKAGDKQIGIEKLLRQLEQERKELQDQNRELGIQRRKYEQLLLEYEEKNRFFKAKKKAFMDEARAEAARLLQGVNQQIEHTIRVIKESQADKAATKEARRELDQLKSQILSQQPAPQPPTQPSRSEPEEPVPNTIEQGAYVRIKGQMAIGEVLELQGRQALVGLGSLKTSVPIQRLERVSRKAYRNQEAAREPSSGVKLDLVQKKSVFTHELDLRGKRADEAMMLFEAFMDDALLSGASSLTILHGKGDGILREMVRNQLRGYQQVAHFQDGHADRGGHGVTHVELH